MIKAFKYFLPLLSVPLVIACGSNSNKSNNQTTIKHGTDANEECVVSVRCQNSSVSLTGAGTDWTHTLDHTVTTGLPCSFFFRANLGYNLSSDIFSIEKKEGGEKITEYTYEAVDEKVRKLTFTPTEDVYVNVVADTTCVTATINATTGVTAGFKYNGSLTYVDWGDGTVDQETSHTYNVTQECVITIAGNISSVSFSDSAKTVNAYSGNDNITKIELKSPIKSIPTYAFSNLKGLTEVDIPETVTKIGLHSFRGASSLEKIIIDDNNSKYGNVNEHGILEKSTNTLIVGVNSLALGEDGVKKIGSYAFENFPLTCVSIPNNIEEIGEYAFSGSKNLNEIKLLTFTEPPTLGDNAFYDCTIQSVFVKNNEVAAKFKADPKWNRYSDDVKTTASLNFSITALEDNTNVSINTYNALFPTINLQWRVDGGDWESNSQIKGNIDLASVNAGQTVEIKAITGNATFSKITDFATGGQSGFRFLCYDTNDSTTGKKFDVSGNILSLLDPNFTKDSTMPSGASFYKLFGKEQNEKKADVVDASLLSLPSNVSDGCYGFMFSGDTELKATPELPSTVVAPYCYYNMFSGCTSLTAAPALPASDLTNAIHCYDSMFSGCASLTKSPNLSAEKIADYCYNSMFSGCTNLSEINSSLPATTIYEGCYQSMFSNCEKITTAPNLPADEVIIRCYDHMFSGCKNLVNAPTISATKFATYSVTTNKTSPFYAMFQGCEKLVTAPTINVDTVGMYFYSNMYEGCTSLKSVPDLTATTLNRYCYLGMFKDCTSLVNAPKITATTVYGNCYQEMFSGCTSLESVGPLLATEALTGCYSSMFFNCTSLVHAPDMSALTSIRSTGTGPDAPFKSMFEGCTSLIDAPKIPNITITAPRYPYQRMFYGCSSLKVTDSGTEDTKICYLNREKDGTDMFTGTKDWSLTLTAGTTYYYVPQA